MILTGGTQTTQGRILSQAYRTHYRPATAMSVDQQLTARSVALPSGVLMTIKYDAVYCVNLPENTAPLTKSPQ
jgi:hypothetical protein